MARDPIPTWFFALVVVRRGDRFLLVHERKHGANWFLPAGRVETGETIEAAAVRETREEAGIDIRLTGIVRVEHSPIAGGARVRVIFLAEPTDDRPPKSVPDDESFGAEWIALDEIGRYALRGPQVEEILRYVAAGGPVFPISILAHEGAPLGI
jgi:8-oxo-dGTP pyrophosphatase MutT (NUDIX family)